MRVLTQFRVFLMLLIIVIITVLVIEIFNEFPEIFNESNPNPKPKPNSILKPNILSGIFVRDAFRITADEIRLVFIMDYRNTEQLMVEIGSEWMSLTYQCFYPVCKGTFYFCTSEGYLASVKIPPNEDVKTITLGVNNTKVRHYVKVIDVRPNKDSYEHILGVMLKPAYYFVDWQSIIQFFESWIAHGATKFYIYHYSWSKQVDAVIRFYQEVLGDSHVEIVPWSAFPVAEMEAGLYEYDSNTRIFVLEEHTACNDALYRSRNQVQFLAIMDIDEILLIKDSTVDILKEWTKKYPTAAQFRLKWILHYVETNLAAEKPGDVDFDYLQTIIPLARNAVNDDYYTHHKLIHIPERVTILDTHNTLLNEFNPESKTQNRYDQIDIKEDEFIVLHIRRILYGEQQQYNTSNTRVNESFYSHIKKMMINFRRRIHRHTFANTSMSPWYEMYKQTIMTLHDCRSAVSLKRPKWDAAGMTQCGSIKGCEQVISGKDSFIFASQSWTDISFKHGPLEHLFPSE